MTVVKAIHTSDAIALPNGTIEDISDAIRTASPHRDCPIVTIKGKG